MVPYELYNKDTVFHANDRIFLAVEDDEQDLQLVLKTVEHLNPRYYRYIVIRTEELAQHVWQPGHPVFELCEQLFSDMCLAEGGNGNVFIRHVATSPQPPRLRQATLGSNNGVMAMKGAAEALQKAHSDIVVHQLLKGKLEEMKQMFAPV